MLKLFLKLIVGVGVGYSLVSGDNISLEANIFITTSIIFSFLIYDWGRYKKTKEIVISVFTYSFMLNFILRFKYKELLEVSVILNILIIVIAFLNDIKVRIEKKHKKRKNR